MYNNEIMNRFTNPQFVGTLRGANGVGMAQDPNTNEIIKFYLIVDENGIIEDAKFKAFGSAVVIAVADATCQTIIGLSVSEAEELHEVQIIDGLGEIPQARLYAPILAMNAINDAINDYHKKMRRLEKQRLREQGMSDDEIKKYLATMENNELFEEPVAFEADDADYDAEEYAENNDTTENENEQTNEDTQEHLSGASILAKYFGQTTN